MNDAMRWLSVRTAWLLAATAASASAQQAPERRIDLEFSGFFKDGQHPLCVYARERGGQWVSAVGSSRIPGKTTVKGAYSFNKGYHWVDLSKAPIAAGVAKGPARVHITPDAWIPSRHLGFTVDMEVDAKVSADGAIEGSYRVTRVSTDDPSAGDLGREGRITGKSKPYAPAPLPDPVTLALNLQGALVGGDPEQGARCLAVTLGFRGRALASATSGLLTQQGESFDVKPFSCNPGDMTLDADGFKGRIAVPRQTLDGTSCAYAFELEGRIMESFAVGAYRMTATPKDGKVVELAGSFDGRWSAGMRQPEPAAVATAAPVSAQDLPWWTAVKGFTPPAPGEHPRLLFRKADVPALRAKAQTPAGKTMVARLKFLLGGGEAMPTEYNTNPPLNIGPKGPGQLKPGAFTVSHAAGFGLLYQLTGERKYADLARQCLDKVFDGQVDRDERYSWKAPGTGFRLSYVHQGVAIAYDLCYEVWPADYRQKVVKEIQTNAPGALQANGDLTLEMLAGGGKYPPSSNHYGAYVAGAGFAALALRGDPGADSARLDKVLARVESSLRTLFSAGFGDGGWFGEGAGSDTTATQPGIAGLLQSLRVAAGQDWCSGKPNARMVILTRILEMVPGAPGEVHRPDRGHYAYGTKPTGRGYFCTGIGALPEAYRPGMAWVYENFFEPGKRPEDRIYEAGIDPLSAVYSFVNWPFDSAQGKPVDRPAANPTGVFPLAVYDSLHGYVLCRNRIRDSQDCLFTGLARRGPVGYHKVRAPQRVDVWGLGLRTTMGALKGDTTHWQPGADGSACFTLGGVPWAVDYSGASGAAAVIVNVGGEAGKAAAAGGAKAVPQTVTAGGRTFNVLVLTEGEVPAIAADGDKLKVGGQTIACDGKQIVLSVFASAR